MIIDSTALPSVQRGRRGTVVFIDDDALGIARQLEEMKFPEGYGKLRLAWNEFQESFTVIQVKDDGSEHIVTAAKQADGRLIDRVRRITHSSYNFAAELEAIDAQADKERDWLFSEKVGDLSERLAHAVRKDQSTPRADINRIAVNTQAKNRIYLPNGISER